MAAPAAGRRGPPDGTIGISAVGMCSALGDVVTACAAARAGIRRARELDGFPVFSLADGSVAGLVVHPAGDLTDGFEGSARLLRLTHIGLADLVGRLERPSGGSRVAFYLSLAPGEASASDDPEPARRLLATAGRIAGWPGEPVLVFLATSGHTGTAEALAKARADLDDGRIDLAIVGGVDSLLGKDTLMRLDDAERLKTANRAVGLEPGEAAAFLALERLRDAPGPTGRRFLAWVDEVALARDARATDPDTVPVGEGLARAVLAAAARADHEALPWVLSDHNGESLRAADWGHAVVRLRAASPAFASPRVWYPAIAFGDTGAASGAVAACVAVRAFDRGYAPAQRAIAIAAADGPERSAVLLRAPDA